MDPQAGHPTLARSGALYNEMNVCNMCVCVFLCCPSNILSTARCDWDLQVDVTLAVARHLGDMARRNFHRPVRLKSIPAANFPHGLQACLP